MREETYNEKISAADRRNETEQSVRWYREPGMETRDWKSEQIQGGVCRQGGRMELLLITGNPPSEPAFFCFLIIVRKLWSCWQVILVLVYLAYVYIPDHAVFDTNHLYLWRWPYTGKSLYREIQYLMVQRLIQSQHRGNTINLVDLHVHFKWYDSLEQWFCSKPTLLFSHA